MPSDRSGEPWTGATYHGFSGPSEPPPAAPAPRAAPVRPTVSTRNLMIGGVTAAVALGLVFGLWARTPGQRETRLSAKAEAATPASVPIEVAQAPPMTLPQNTGRMEVLAPDQVASARASAPLVAAAVPRAPLQPQFVEGSNSSAIAPRIEDPPLPRLRRGAIDCGAPASASEQAICEDAGLVPAEHRLTRAERRAQRQADEEAAFRAQSDDEGPPDEDPGL